VTTPRTAGGAAGTQGVSGLRHNLRTPVNAVLGYSEMLLEECPDHHRDLSTIVDAARAVLATIDAALPPTATSVDAAALDALRAAMTPAQARILAAADVLGRRDAEGDGSMAADLARIADAARRLTAFEVPAAAPRLDPDRTMWGDETPTMMGGAAPEPPVAVEPTAVPFQILVVDDVADNRAVLERRLQREGHMVVCARDGHDALEKIRERSFDLILLDIMMPEVDGFEVLRRLKRDPQTRDIPVIMISALDDLDSVVRCISEGAEDHLTKPFEPVLLRARINASLDKKRFRDREVEYIREVKTIAEAATAVEAGQYDAASLSRAALRTDELGRLARVFDGMAAQVKAREDRLRRQVNELRQAIGLVRSEAAADDTGTHLLPGFVLAGRYEIEAVVGFGAMGTVYRARDRELAEIVAVKVLRPDLLSDATVLERFKAEVRLARRISHPTVVRTHDLGESEGVHYLTMEFVEGVTGRALLDDRGRLGPAAVLALATQLAHGLDAAHAQGVIHRDIKPQNLLLDARGTLKIMDFGVSRLSGSADGSAEAGLLIGTPAYMAPEQLLGQEIDERADLYATGVVLFECLTGRLPFEAASPVALVARMMAEAPASADAIQPDVPSPLAAIITRLLARRREDRPATAGELGRLLAQIG
jgi:CheY-like chemotaxis protein